MSLFSFFIILSAISGALLFGLSYVGVDIAIFLVPIFLISSIIAYCIRPKTIKKIQNETSRSIKYGLDNFANNLEKYNKKLDKKKIKELEKKIAKLEKNKK